LSLPDGSAQRVRFVAQRTPGRPVPQEPTYGVTLHISLLLLFQFARPIHPQREAGHAAPQGQPEVELASPLNSSGWPWAVDPTSRRALLPG
jgi:hypothetical protein